MKKSKKRKFNPPLSKSNLSRKENMRSRFDPNGSWTGTAETPDGYPVPPSGEYDYIPEQDVDDL